MSTKPTSPEQSASASGSSAAPLPPAAAPHTPPPESSGGTAPGATLAQGASPDEAAVRSRRQNRRAAASLPPDPRPRRTEPARPGGRKPAQPAGLPGSPAPLLAPRRDPDGLDKHSLRTDAYQEFMARAIRWGQAHAKSLLAAGLGVLALAVGLVAYGLWRNVLLEQQGLELNAVERIIADSSKTREARRKAASEQLTAFVEKHASSPLAPGAWMRLAALAWDGDDPATAEKAFMAVRSHAKSEALLRMLATIGAAKLKIKQEKPDEALALLTALPERPHGEFKHYHLGQLALQQDQREKARGHFEQVLTLAPQSPLASYAETTLRFLP